MCVCGLIMFVVCVRCVNCLVVSAHEAPDLHKSCLFKTFVSSSQLVSVLYITRVYSEYELCLFCSQLVCILSKTSVCSEHYLCLFCSQLVCILSKTSVYSEHYLCLFCSQLVCILSKTNICSEHNLCLFCSQIVSVHKHHSFTDKARKQVTVAYFDQPQRRLLTCVCTCA